MGRARRAAVGTVVAVAAAATVAGASYGVWALSETTDQVLQERTGTLPVSEEPMVAGTEASRPAQGSTQVPTEGPTEGPTTTITPEPEPEPVLAPGDRGRKVRELQARLAQLEWYAPPMTGGYDRETRQAVRGFQGKREFEVTGEVDPRTWRRLVRMSVAPTGDEMFNRSGRPLFERGDQSSDVRRVQARLRQIAWFFGDVSDFYGDQTVAAVEGFQAKRRVPVTGKVDQKTLDLLVDMTSDPTADELANRQPDPAEGSPLDPRCRTGRVLCIDKSSNSLRWVVDGDVLTTVDVRFGSDELPTREGSFSVFAKSRDHVSSLYDTAMPFAMFFSGGQAVHYSPDFAANGYSGASHGCVNVRDYSTISSLFNQVNTGDRVVVYWS